MPTPRRRAPRTPFVVLIIGMLAAGLLGVLILNTQRAQDAFSLTSIQKHNAQLNIEVQTLRGEVQQDQTPATIASRAAAIGMVPGGDPVFVDPTGKILGIGAAGVVALSTGQRVGDIVVIGKATPKPIVAATPTIQPTTGPADTTAVTPAAGTAATVPQPTTAPTTAATTGTTTTGTTAGPVTGTVAKP